MEVAKYGEKIASWEFSEDSQHERSIGWYVWAIIIAVILLIYSVFTANFLFAVIILIVSVIIFVRMSEGHTVVLFEIYEDGIRMGDKFYDFSEIKSFFIIYEPPQVKNLYFYLNSWRQPRMQIPLGDIDPLRLREVLLEYIEEDLDQDEEPFSDAASRFFKL